MVLWQGENFLQEGSDSDIDIFIVNPDGISEREAWLTWNKKLREMLKVFERDITV